MGKVELKVEIDAEVLAAAEEAGLPVSRLAEQSLRRALADVHRYRGLTDEQKAQLWADENAEAIKAQRERIEAVGMFGEDLRSW